MSADKLTLYHGTSAAAGRNIDNGGFVSNVRERERYREQFGEGHYLTAQIEIAHKYGRSKADANGDYAVVTAAVNAKDVKVVPDSVTGHGNYYITKSANIEVRDVSFYNKNN